MSPNYRPYIAGEDGEPEEISTEKFAEFLGIDGETAQMMLRAMNVVKTICLQVGAAEEPPLTWNENMPESLVSFVSKEVMEGVKGNPDYAPGDFPYEQLYEDDGETLKFR